MFMDGDLVFIELDVLFVFFEDLSEVIEVIELDVEEE